MSPKMFFNAFIYSFLRQELLVCFVRLFNVHRAILVQSMIVEDPLQWHLRIRFSFWWYSSVLDINLACWYDKLILRWISNRCYRYLSSHYNDRKFTQVKAGLDIFLCYKNFYKALKTTCLLFLIKSTFNKIAKSL